MAQRLASANEVTVFDNLATGKRRNIPREASFQKGDIGNEELLRKTLRNMDLVFHMAAIPSVARSVSNPLPTHATNATGTISLLEACRKRDVRTLVYAASSSAYGDTPVLPKNERMLPNPESPYAASKLAGEFYVQAYCKLYGLRGFALRYFNVYGPRQDPRSRYAAVIPRFLLAAQSRRPLVIYGDGRQTRDFTFVEDAVAASVLAASNRRGKGDVVNVSGGKQISLLTLVRTIERLLARKLSIVHRPAQPGDIRHSLASLEKARAVLGYRPKYHLERGLQLTIQAFQRRSRPSVLKGA